MNRKGFTLAEILGVIVILSLLMVIIVPTVINRITGTRGDAASAGEEIVFKAADEYISDYPSDFPKGKAGRYCITLKELMDDGKLVPTGTSGGKDVYVDSISGDDWSNLSVMVTIYSSGIRDYELKEGDTCEELASLPIIDFLVEPSGNAWVKQRVVTILYPKLDGYTYQYKIDDGNWTDAGSLNDYNNDYYSKELPAFTKITTLYARARGNNVINGRVQLGNIDSEKPAIRNVSVPSGWSNKNKTATATVYDGISGVKSYYLSTSSNKPSENSSGWKDVNYSKGEKTIKLNDLDNGTYYLWVKDKAGNISDTTNNTKFVVDKVDKEAPTCSIKASGTLGNSGWYRGNITLTLNYSDTGGSGVNKYGMGTSSIVNYNSKKTMSQTSDTLGITYYGYVKDAAGNTNNCNISVKKDATKPTCSTTKSGTLGNSGWYRGNVYISLSYRDSGSGINNYGLSTSSSTTYNRSKSATRTGDTSGTTYYGYVQDVAGNTNSCSTTVKKDTGYPSCSISSSTSSKVISLTLRVSGYDSLSGLASSPYSWSSSSSGFSSSNSYTVRRNGTYWAYVRDTAGNTSSCSRTVNNIIVKPNTPTLYNPTGGNWVNYNFQITGTTTTSADIIGYWYYSYDNSSWTIYNNSSYNSYGKTTFNTSPFSAERNQPVYIRVCNKEASGGNDTTNCSNSASTMIRIDKTPPSIIQGPASRDCGYSNNGFDTGSRFGYYVSDSGSGVNTGSINMQYCYVNYNNTCYGLKTCAGGWSPAIAFNNNEGSRYYSWSAVSNACSIGQTVRSLLTARDNVGNTASREVSWGWPGSSGNCYNF